MAFLDRVIADLDADRTIVAFPNMHPIGAFSGYSLFSQSYDENYGNGTTWHVIARFDAVFMGFPVTELRRDGMVVPLTKKERKRLRKAADLAIGTHVKLWEAKRAASRL